MTLPDYVSQNVAVNANNLSGGLNSNAGGLNASDNESTDLQNVDFNKFGSVLKRSGYATLNSTVATISTGSITQFADGGDDDTQVTSSSHGLSNGDLVQITGTTSYNGLWTINSVAANTFVIETAFVADDATGTWNETGAVDGLHWFEFVSSGATVRKATCLVGGKFFKMDDLDGTWDDATNGQTITAGNHADFENWRNKLFITNNEDAPLEWDGAGTSSLTTMTVPSGLTEAKFNSQFNNYLFLANVTVSGTRYASRIYWSNLNDEGTWTATDFIDVSNNDGQEITGIRVLADRLVIFKTRSIYNLFFTGDSDVPFILPGGGKSNSAVGCVAPFSIQELENGIAFLSFDGFYFYDGNNSFKISDKITTTILGYNTTKFDIARSLVQKQKNRYMCALPDSGETENNKVLVWDYFNNAWSVYSGISASSMATFFVDGDEERPYFGDYSGFVYRMDTGSNDNPLGVETAISSYFYTNWKSFGDTVDKKSVPNIALYYQNSNSILTLAYSYDFESGDTFQNTVFLGTSGDTYGSGVYGTAAYSGSGGAVARRDLTGRGRVVRFKFENSTLDETFQIDGLGMFPQLETNA